MHKKVDLFEIPPFFVETELTQDIINLKAREFDIKRGEYGFERVTQAERHKLRRKFCAEYKFKIAFDSIISYEIWKQGRTKLWLHRCLTERGFKLTYTSLCQKITGYARMDKDMKFAIHELLKIY